MNQFYFFCLTKWTPLIRPFKFGTAQAKDSDDEDKKVEDEKEDEEVDEKEEDDGEPKAKMANLNRHESRALLATLDAAKLGRSVSHVSIVFLCCYISDRLNPSSGFS